MALTIELMFVANNADMSGHQKRQICLQVEGAEIANTKLNLYYESLSQKGVQILQKDVKIEYNANNWGISGDFVVNVAQMEKIYREQVENTIQ